MTTVTNWAGNITFRAERLHRPTSVEELADVVAAAPRIRPLGTGHSFNTIADSDAAMVSTTELPSVFEVADDAATVTVSGGTRYGEVARQLHAQGLALHNLGSLPHISVAGAIATGTHGSGDRNGSLAASVRGIEVVTADGSLVRITRDNDPDVFPGAVVTLGLLGVVTRVTLAVEPTYDIEQRVYDSLPVDAAIEHLSDVMASGYSVSCFTTYQRPAMDMVWVKRRPDDAPGVDLEALGATAADGPRHPIPGVDPVHCTQQLGAGGAWHERLPHFRLEFTPSAGEELQTEYLLARDRAPEALRALQGIADLIAPVLQISEVRSIAADDLWLSGAYGRDTIALHFTWIADTGAVTPVVAAVEERLADLDARPHWGKVFTMPGEVVRTRYPRFDDFASLVARMDPTGKFRNEFTDAVLE